MPAQVTIPPLAAQATFYVAAVRDDTFTGPRLTTISARSLDALGNLVGNAASQLLVVEDDQGPALKVRVMDKVVAKGLNPATSALVWRNTLPTNDLAVYLTSSATSEVSVPAMVTIKAGATNTTFPIASLNDGIVHTSQSVLVMATATNYASGSDTILVTDLNLPDPVITGISAPASADLGSPVTVALRLLNQGLGPLTTNVTENVYFTADPASGSNVLVGSVSFAGPLAAGQAADLSVVIPGTALAATGDEWVVAVADATANALELDKANNTAVSTSPISVAAQAHGDGAGRLEPCAHRHFGAPLRCRFAPLRRSGPGSGGQYSHHRARPGADLRRGDGYKW